MKKLFLSIIILLNAYLSVSQTDSVTYGIQVNNSDSIISCNAVLRHDLSLNTFYSPNQDWWVSIRPTTFTQATQLYFDYLELGLGDTLFIYEGNNTLSPLVKTITSLSDVPIFIRANINNARGSLTLRFKSDTGTSLLSIGRWRALITCKTPCQTIGATILNTSPPINAQNEISICKGQEVTFNGQGSYLQNDLKYHQSDTTSKFQWKITDGWDTSAIFAKTIKHKFNQEGGYYVKLKIIDTAGCVNNIEAQVKVVSGIKPTFNFSGGNICQSDTIQIIGNATFPQGIFSSPPVVADTLGLPDGAGLCYENFITISTFLPTQKITNSSDIEHILMNMEHSYLGDLEITLTAPNGTSVKLKKSTGTSTTWDTYLGEPVDEPTSGSALALVAGKGYDYYFNATPTYGTMATERGKYTYSYIDKAGQSVSNHYYLPSGYYASEDPLSAFIGSPLNGQWKLQICDRFAVDNGWIFGWSIKFKQSLFPITENYQTYAVSKTWLPATGLINSIDSLAIISPQSSGAIPYIFRITDNKGCNYDTTIIINSLPKPIKPNLGIDTSVCLGSSYTIRNLNHNSSLNYVWSTGITNVDSLVVFQPNTYWIKASNSDGCINSDSILITQAISPQVNLGIDTFYCASNPNIITATTSSDVTNYLWNNSSTASSLNTTGGGTYWLEVNNMQGCKARDSIILTNNLINSFTLPADTSICEGINHFVTLNPPTGTQLTWDNGSTSLTQNLNQQKTYSIIANYIGCIKKDSLILQLKPLPKISAGIDTTLCIGFKYPITISYPGATYLWNTGSTDSNFVISQEGLYWVQGSLNGCNYRDSINVKYQKCDCELFIPNAFSPNGDGINDVFKPTIKCFPANYRMSIFNRSGIPIFSTEDYLTGWNGTQNGKPLPISTFYYIITFYNTLLNKNERYTGSITLLK
jgi:gliding motility-associated-like protein